MNERCGSVMNLVSSSTPRAACAAPSRFWMTSGAVGSFYMTCLAMAHGLISGLLRNRGRNVRHGDALSASWAIASCRGFYTALEP